MVKKYVTNSGIFWNDSLSNMQHYSLFGDEDNIVLLLIKKSAEPTIDIKNRK
jgi:hypothetical protein